MQGCTTKKNKSKRNALYWHQRRYAMVTRAQRASTERWKRNNYDRLAVYLGRGERAALHQTAREAGESTNTYVRKAIQERTHREKGE